MPSGQHRRGEPHQRQKVFQRDHGICAACGIFGGLWQADHIVPLIDGGGFGLDNLQTLCVPCHKAKTAAEASRRADHRLARVDRGMPPRFRAIPNWQLALALVVLAAGAVVEREPFIALVLVCAAVWCLVRRSAWR